MRLIPSWVWLGRLRRCQAGAAAVEFALSLPLLVTVVIGGAEYTRYCIANQKLERVAASVADLVAQGQGVSLADLQTVFSAVDNMMQPFSLDNAGRVIVTSVSGQSGRPVVQWQEAYGSSSDHSRVGVKGGTATLPAGLNLRDGENVIVCESFMLYEPMFATDLLEANRLYRVAAYRPRFGALEADPRG